MRTSPPPPWSGGTLAVLVGLCALFVASMRMPSLYFQNQNTKFLQGLATAFPDRLGADWTANTVDGLPMFTGLVHAVAAWADPAVFYLIEVALLSTLFFSLVRLAQWAAPERGASLVFLVAMGSFLAVMVHPPRGDTLEGVAGQYLTRGYFQPAEFGILFLPALLLALRRHPAALLLAAIPAAFHPTYITFSAVALLVFYGARRRAGLRTSPLLLAICAALLVLPPLDLALRFAPTDPDLFQRANDILAFERIPHHSDPLEWVDERAWRKLGLAVLAIVLAPPGMLRWLLGAYAGLAVAGALFVAATGNAELALVAPWRTSVVVVPIAMAVVSGRLLDVLFARGPQPWLSLAIAAPMLGWAVLTAADGAATKWVQITDPGVPDYVEHIRATRSAGDVYLTSPEMSEFRLEAMVPQYITWKTHPYLDTEVIEWNRRASLAARVFPIVDRRMGFDCAALRTFLETETVSHVLVPTPEIDAARDCGPLAEQYRGGDFTVFAVTGQT